MDHERTLMVWSPCVVATNSPSCEMAMAIVDSTCSFSGKSFGARLVLVVGAEGSSLSLLLPAGPKNDVSNVASRVWR